MPDGILEHCTRCERACLETFAFCLEVGGSHLRGRHVQALLDCAEVAALCHSFLARGSRAVDGIMTIYSELAERSAHECEAFDDTQMRACARACRASAEACRNHISEQGED